MKIKINNTTAGTVPKYNRYVVETEAKSIPLIHFPCMVRTLQ